ncbi:MAG: hypothetical protein RMX96_17985 [Nostoc sp. ChiSLP02]|nr:hypothetical protein [Nostoc sp. ChiSLP02]
MHTFWEFQQLAIKYPHDRSCVISGETKLGFKSPNEALITVHCSAVVELILLANLFGILNTKHGKPTNFPYFSRKDE